MNIQFPPLGLEQDQDQDQEQEQDHLNLIDSGFNEIDLEPDDMNFAIALATSISSSSDEELETSLADLLKTEYGSDASSQSSEWIV